MPPKIKHRASVVMRDSKGKAFTYGYWGGTGVQEFTDTYGRNVHLQLPVGKEVGKVETFTITVEYLGEHKYKQTYEQRVKAQARSEKQKERRAKEEEKKKEAQLLQRRQRIMNQIELAFVKQGRNAVNFVTCDKCDATAIALGLAYETPGSKVIDPDQITGAMCGEHSNKYCWPFKTTASIQCALLEFFYDGLRQIYVKG
jgi:hypothetical protein